MKIKYLVLFVLCNCLLSALVAFVVVTQTQGHIVDAASHIDDGLYRTDASTVAWHIYDFSIHSLMDDTYIGYDNVWSSAKIVEAIQEACYE